MQILDSFSLKSTTTAASQPKPFNGNTRLRENVRRASRKWSSIKDHDWITKLVFFGYATLLTMVGVFLQIHQVPFYHCALFYMLGAACAVAGIKSKTLQDISQKEKAAREASHIISAIAKQENCRRP